jgi:hypothetical protein
MVRSFVALQIMKAWPGLRLTDSTARLVLACRDIKEELDEALFLPLQLPHL